MTNTQTAVIDMVERQPNRTLLYPSPTAHYYIIAPKDADVAEYDTIAYEPCDVNRGLYVSTIRRHKPPEQPTT